MLAEEVAPRDLRDAISEVRGSRIVRSDPQSALFGLTVDQLCSLVMSLLRIDEERAWQEFREYRFSDRPNLYLRSINGALPRDSMSPSALEDPINVALSELNAKLCDGETDPSIKDFQLLDIGLAGDLIEIDYQVSHRVDLVAHDLTPRTEYTTLLGTSWIDPGCNMMLINAPGSADAAHLSIALAEALAVSGVECVTLTRSLTEHVADEATIQTSGFQRAAEDDAGPSTVRLGDPQLAKRNSYRDYRDGGKYRTTYGYYRLVLPQSLSGKRLGVGITRKTGRFWIPYALARSELADIARWLMRSISEKRDQLYQSSLPDALATYDAALGSHMPRQWQRGDRRNAVFALVAAIVDCLRHDRDLAPTEFDAFELGRVLGSEWLAIEFQATCEACNADTNAVCRRCGGMRFRIVDNKSLVCIGCDSVYESTGHMDATCQCGNTMLISDEACVVLTPTRQLIDGIGQIVKAFDASMDLMRHGFVVVGPELQMLRDLAPPRVLTYKDVSELRQIQALDAYPLALQKEVDRRLGSTDAGKEKCNGVKSAVTGGMTWPCNQCSPLAHPNRECLRTIVIDQLGYGLIEPHSGSEIGDLIIDITVDGVQVKAFAFAKHMARGELRSTNSTGRELLAQVWQRHSDDTFAVVIILSNCKVAQNLKIAVEDMARYGGKSVLYLDSDAMKRMYLDNVSRSVHQGRPFQLHL